MEDILAKLRDLVGRGASVRIFSDGSGRVYSGDFDSNGESIRLFSFSNAQDCREQMYNYNQENRKS